MKFAIIAAGEGSRLVNEGVTTPKPLVRLNGEPMIDRLIRIFIANNASSISIIVNNEMSDVYEHVRRLNLSVPLHIIQKSTPSSMHSFYELSHTLGGDRFCLTTVDTIFREEEFALYIDAFKKCKADGLFAVTNYIDDEKPLYVEIDTPLIKSFNDNSPLSTLHSPLYISAGIYCLQNNSIPILKRSVEEGMHRMRNYQRRLVEEGLVLHAWPFSKVIDVDHQDDILKAEIFLKNSNNL
jgi:Nucleoside-diphosphate-sugar pyrophosphorylase involved in lipopolysaccharide biosynthesis/translation initiation factor 2B, gamma/epsilon subunits (eIF-2Bgamma/eIF-2Bepsilon)